MMMDRWMKERAALVCATSTLLVLVSLPPLARAENRYAPLMPRAAQALLLDIAAAGSRTVAVGERGIALYSDDAGASWQQARVPTRQMLTGVHFANARHGWAVAHDGLILASDDGGETWRLQRDGLAAQQRANREQRARAQRTLERIEEALQRAGEEARPALESRREEALLDLEDAELALEEPVFTSPLMDVWFQDAERGWAVGAFGTFLGTSDGGENWSSLAPQIDNPDELHLYAITGDGRGRVFIAGEGGIMYRSPDGGRNWQTLEPLYEGSWFGLAYSQVHDTLLLCGLQGKLFRSGDFGSHWADVSSDTSLALAGATAGDDGRIAVVGAVGTLLESQDGGKTFVHRTLSQRRGLSAALYTGGGLILVGQGGALSYPGAESER
jgi:photosystem II stability/assembly factor-like uncharacterized protein